MRKEESARLRAEMEQYFKERGWVWELPAAMKLSNQMFHYGASVLIKPTIRREA